MFEEYRDPCRAGAGQEKPWVIGAVTLHLSLFNIFEYTKKTCALCCVFSNDVVLFTGTLLEQPTLYHEDVATLENLQR